MGCSSCGNSTGGCNCSSSSNCGCGGDCGQPTKIITKQGLTGPAGANGTNGTNGADGRGYDATSSATIDVLNTTATGAGGVISVEKAYTAGARVRFSDTANPQTNYFEGICVSYDPVSGAMTVGDIDLKAGSGVISSWDVNLAGEPSYLYTGTSTTSLNLDTEKNATAPPGSAPLATITTQKYLAYKTGTIVRIADTANPSTNFIEGIVSSYNIHTGELIINGVNVLRIEGTGVVSSWTLDLATTPMFIFNDTTSDLSYDLTAAPTSVSGSMSRFRAFVIGSKVRFTANAGVDYFEGFITSYNTKTGAVSIDNIVATGSGTFTSWTVALA